MIVISKLSIILSLLTCTASILGVWQIFQLVEINEETKRKINLGTNQIDSLDKQHKGLLERHARDFSRERDKNRELEFELSEREQNRTKIENNLLNEENMQADFSQRRELLEKEILSVSNELHNVENNYKTKFSELQKMNLNFPNLEASLDQLRRDLSSLQAREKETEEKLENYAEVSRILSINQDNILKALRLVKYEKPWRGKIQNLEIKELIIDWESGLLALPFGREHGIRKEKFYSVSSSGKLICKVKITEASLLSSIGSILPLVGKIGSIKKFADYDIESF